MLTPDDLLEIHAIERLKHRYLRCLDLKLWDEIQQCFTEDATASYGGGAYVLEGRAAILAFLWEKMGSEQMLTSHRCTQPEIDLVGEDEATGIWALQDVVVHQEHGINVQGAAFYEDRYRRVGGIWLIAHTGYKRTYEEIFPREGRTLTADLWATGGRSKLG